MEKLLEIAKNPEPFEGGTQEIWLDPDRADFVLKSHFDENILMEAVGKEVLLMKPLISLAKLHQ
nr:hypothetical protein P5651_01980 [Bacillus subtilis]